MERSEVSLHEVRVYRALANQPGQWMTNEDIIKSVTGVAPRTVRAHTKRLVDLGVLDQLEVFPHHLYRLSDKAEKRNQSYVQRLLQAMDAMLASGMLVPES